ncbi:MAG: hypothetical protein FD163_2053 [Hyphomonadaceae bacterium]|mgnify:CR=1 FL=1|nr:MAG: hypothetical protein FD128_372 [Hyphomonadaceae bacterium]KAF0183859.1 MAG: hypothetical protein FD163_2053 [Hyphomonadaceae bacterium]
MKTIFRILPLLIAIALPLSAQARPHNRGFEAAIAQSFNGSYPSPLDIIVAQQNRTLSLREVAQIIGSQIPGRLSDANLVNEGGRMVYVVRWEPSDDQVRGRIIIFVIDAETGQIISRRGG